MDHPVDENAGPPAAEPIVGGDPGAAGELPEEVHLVVDVANVVGSRPDGWWRDRAGAATRLLVRLAALTAGPGGPPPRIGAVHAVVEGAAREVPGVAGVEVVRAPADGDGEVVRRANLLLSQGAVPLVVTADRGLRGALPPGCPVRGPRWLLDRLPPG